MGYWKDKLPSWLFNSLENQRKNLFGKPRKTYSLEGEDLIIEKLTRHINKGLYVDVGCYHPKVSSNTFKLHKLGWDGINIDPNPNTIKLFKKYRPEAINLNLGISENGEALSYYEFTETAVSTFSKEFYEMRINQGSTFVGERIIQTETLENIFEKYLNGRHIDVLDIDTEGIDLQVLKSNNWNKFRPQLILVEDQDENIDNIEQLETYKFLFPKGYKLIAKSISTAVYLSN